MLARFRTFETVLLLAAALGLIAALGQMTGLGLLWTSVLAASFVVFAYGPAAVRLQDWLFERYLANGWFVQALRIATAVRAGARAGLSRELAELDVGLVHLARGANDDAVRSFRRIERHRLKPHTRLVVATYEALAELRRSQAGAQEVVAAADAALAENAGDPYLLAAKGEGVLALGDASDAEAMLTESLQYDPDPCDPSPGERHLILARAAARAGHAEVAKQSYRVAAALRATGPFVRAARAELAELESRA